ncbi:hypothetical protein GDI1415 [Gluconacetobacter diazotrophicus PA1 5]|uniref:Uncharacterized protein n=1 Tax=Gluconacetobacter diazotrophicus (strain ATCC 49037 / DSM 5601 / CCUG 37298 / CIP 103539 / LMG 7603 / PAl5) TaxID=272568 RepID=A9HFG3_GLUDA|nr:hypothetical protein GDI1415 [Gluconacetobacter diazotrophicus PA1 5]
MGRQAVRAGKGVMIGGQGAKPDNDAAKKAASEEMSSRWRA